MAGRGNETNFSNPYGNRKPAQQTSSLLLSPPGNNFLFSNMDDSAMLVPVSQDFATDEDQDEAGQFLGGGSGPMSTARPNSEPPSLQSSSFQPPSSSGGGYSQGGSSFASGPPSFGSAGNLGSSTGKMFPPPPAGGPPMRWPGPPPAMNAPAPSYTNNTPLRPRYVNPFGGSSSADTYRPNAPVGAPYGAPVGGAGTGFFNPPVTAVPRSGPEMVRPTTVGVGGAPWPPPTQPTVPRYPFAPPQASHPPPPLYSPGNTPGSPPPPLGVATVYSPVQPHWFYCKMVEKRQRWFPFSLVDSVHLEEEHQKLAEHPNPASVVVATDGGRYDVQLQERKRSAVYWEERPSIVRRATWFYRMEGDRKFLPYPEHFSEKLEEEYNIAVTTNTWHRRLEFPDNESVIIHNHNVIVHYQPSEWDGTTGVPDSQAKPRVVKRGMDETENVEDGEAMQIDHLVFVVHGIGAICDLKFRTIREVVDDFRSISNQLIGTHFKKHVDENRIGRVEFLPVSWHTFLHGDATGIDEKLKPITLKSIPKLRYFANDAILDVLFYTSPVFCQTIITQVSSELNRLHAMFLSRNPTFAGKVSLAGHSLGSTILFDLLVHQADSSQAGDKQVSSPVVGGSQSAEQTQSPTESKDSTPSPVTDDDTAKFKCYVGETTNHYFDIYKGMKKFSYAKRKLATGGILTLDLPSFIYHFTKPEISINVPAEPIVEDRIQTVMQQLGLDEYLDLLEQEKMDMDSLIMCSESDLKEMGIPLGPRKKLMDFFKKRQAKLDEKEARDFVTEMQQQQPPQAISSLPARRRKQSETTINYIVGLAGTGHPYVSYPRLTFQPTCFFALGSPIAMFLTVRGADVNWEDFRFPTCPGFFNIFHPFDPVAYRIEPLVDPTFDVKPVLIPHHKGRKRMHLEIKESLGRVGADLKQKLMESLKITWNTIHDFARAHRVSAAQLEADLDKDFQDELMSSGHHATVDDDALSTISGQDREEDIAIGQLNGGRRIDYVLQEKPIESFNEYLFALGSHTCYWESEDTVLLLLKEIYCSYGIQPSAQGAEPPPKPHPVHYGQYTAPSPSSSFQQPSFPPAMAARQQPPAAPSSWFQPPPPVSQARPAAPVYAGSSPYQPHPSAFAPNQLAGQRPVFGMDPTAPPADGAGPAPPPPRTGFVKQSIVKK